ncbi:MAG: radical SAM protein, partial [Bacteroidales bacterium]|nr:radical SAM protein [Bacteroidales bacterium]
MKEIQLSSFAVKMKWERPVVYSFNPPFPGNLEISLNSTCNHQCIFCPCYKPRKNLHEKAIVMPKDKAFDLIGQAYNLGVRDIGFISYSEPLLYKNLEDCVAYARDLGYTYVYLTTNGSLADRDRLSKLFTGTGNGGLHSLRFSVNAGNRETYKNIHGRDDFDTVINNIVTANELRNELKLDIPLFVSFVETPLNKGQWNLLEKKLKNIVDRLYVFPARNNGGYLQEELQSGIVEPVKTVKPLMCPQPFNRFQITPEGYLTTCCVDADNSMVVADLNKVSLKDAWYCDNMLKVRSYFLDQAIPTNS